MRRQYLIILAASIAAWAVSAAGNSTADETREAEKTFQASGEIRVVDPAAEEAKKKGGEPDDAEEDAGKPTGGVPTPAKRKPEQAPERTDQAPADTPEAKQPKPTPAAAEPKPTAEQPRPGAEPLKPIPDPMEAPPVEVETASFKDVTPGVSTKEDVEQGWGKPKDAMRSDGTLVQLYSIEPFRQVEITYNDDKVSSIVIRLGRSFPADAVAKQLDLAAIRPVPVHNEMGELLGLAYPERGVLFAFEQDDGEEEPSRKVLHIILEPVAAESFVLRAETTMGSRGDLSRRDLRQALKLEPNNARAHWLLGRVLADCEQHEEAFEETGQAVRLAPDDPQYRVAHAKVLAQLGRLSAALKNAEKAVETSRGRPHVAARATCLIGDLLASGPDPDFKKALKYHVAAIRLADPLSANPHPALRVAAKEVLVDAHLGAAHDIAWGEYKDKQKVVVRWLQRAESFAADRPGP